jgi:hypothetical protein
MRGQGVQSRRKEGRGEQRPTNNGLEPGGSNPRLSLSRGPNPPSRCLGASRWRNQSSAPMSLLSIVSRTLYAAERTATRRFLRYRSPSVRWCRTRCAVQPGDIPTAESRLRALAAPAGSLTVPPYAGTRGNDGLLDLQPPDYGVHSKGIYIIDDDGLSVFAGPFESEGEAIAWIIQRQKTLTRHRSQHALAIH